LLVTRSLVPGVYTNLDAAVISQQRHCMSKYQTDPPNYSWLKQVQQWQTFSIWWRMEARSWSFCTLINILLRAPFVTFWAQRHNNIIHISQLNDQQSIYPSTQTDTDSLLKQRHITSQQTLQVLLIWFRLHAVYW